MMDTYTGRFHCGTVKFEADLELSQSTCRCNRSICGRNRYWPAVARPGGFRLIAAKTALTEYLFDTKRNQHFFCKYCGVRAFGVGNKTPMGNGYSEGEELAILYCCLACRPRLPRRLSGNFYGASMEPGSACVH